MWTFWLIILYKYVNVSHTGEGIKNLKIGYHKLSHKMCIVIWVKCYYQHYYQLLHG